MSHRQEKDGGTFEPAGPENTDTSFVSRWSRRKRDAAAGADRVDTVEAPVPDASREAIPLADESTDPGLTDADMPAVETLGEDSEYGGFLSPGVSEELRRLALRKLFHLPGFNVRDGLDDYDEDFTRFAALGDVMTQDLRHRLRAAAKRDAEREQPSATAHESAAGASSVEADQGPVTKDKGLADAQESGGDEPGSEMTDSDDREHS